MYIEKKTTIKNRVFVYFTCTFPMIITLNTDGDQFSPDQWLGWMDRAWLDISQRSS